MVSYLKFRLWDITNNGNYDSTIYTIKSISNDLTQIVIDNAISGYTSGMSLMMRFPNYSYVSGKQAAKYIYTGIS